MSAALAGQALIRRCAVRYAARQIRPRQCSEGVAGAARVAKPARWRCPRPPVRSANGASVDTGGRGGGVASLGTPRERRHGKRACRSGRRQRTPVR